MAEKGDEPPWIVTPTAKILKIVFPSHDNVSFRIIENTSVCCTSLVSLPQAGSDLDQFILRLQVGPKQLESVAAVQRLAALAIPELVPRVEQVGCAILANGTEVEYSVIEYVEDALGLEALWNDLSDSQQEAIMLELVGAMNRLQQFDLCSEQAQILLAPFKQDCFTSPPLNSDLKFGNVGMGFFEDVPALLRGMIDQTFERFEDINTPSIHGSPQAGITLETNDSTMSVITISAEALRTLAKSICFCHNDLEPRNIFVRRIVEGSPEPRYKIAAIIDWEMAGFFPFSYEYKIVDGGLGRRGKHWTWYHQFKKTSARLLMKGAKQPSEADQAFMEAIDMIDVLYEKRMQSFMVGMRIRQRWIQFKGLIKAQPSWLGWIAPEGDTERKGDTEEEYEALELEVLKEMGRI